MVCEVHDVHGRLQRVCALLRRHGLRVVVEAQAGGTVDGYEMCIPAALRLHYVYACRPPASGGSSSTHVS